MTFVAAFPTKLALLTKRFPVAYTKTFSETSKTVEAPKKKVFKPFSELYFAYDVLRKNFPRSFAETVNVYEIASKTCIRQVSDSLCGEHIPYSYRGKVFLEILRASDRTIESVLKVILEFDRLLISDRNIIYCLINFAEQVLHYDRVKKLVTKIHEYDSIWSGWMYRTVQACRTFPEAVTVFDLIKQIIIKEYIDLVTTYDRMTMLKVYTRIFTDNFESEYGLSKNILIPRKDAELTIDILYKEIGKLFREHTFASEFITKYVTKQLVERNILRELVTKYITTNVFDLTYSIEIVAKVMYSLAQQIVRRVYFLPPEYEAWWDIILPSDHNTKVLICKAFLDAFKRVSDKLLGVRVPVSDTCKVSDSVEVITT
jgi:hypothetical protein